jgi:hypothetical protein
MISSQSSTTTLVNTYVHPRCETESSPKGGRGLIIQQFTQNAACGPQRRFRRYHSFYVSSTGSWQNGPGEMDGFLSHPTSYVIDCQLRIGPWSNSCVLIVSNQTKASVWLSVMAYDRNEQRSQRSSAFLNMPRYFVPHQHLGSLRMLPARR